MTRDPNHRYANDPRESDVLARLALSEPDDEAVGEALAILHYRGTAQEFAIARELAADPDPVRRSLAADIMGQLGWGDQTFLEESVEALLDLLDDSTPTVAAHAATALGFRNHPRAIPRLLRLLGHGEADVRLGVVHGLSGHDDLGAVGGLIRLTSDDDRDVRDWATFGLASLTDVDSPELRDALLVRTADDDHEIRGEALIGLARCRHPEALDLVRDELHGPFHGDWAIEAAELLADSSLHSALEAAWASMSPEDRTHFGRSWAAAFEACAPDRRTADS